MNFLSRWFGKRQTPTVTPEVPVTRLPPGEGWRQWQYVSHDDMLMLYTADQVETWHASWNHGPVIESPRKMHPARNILGLWWRPIKN